MHLDGSPFARPDFLSAYACLEPLLNLSLKGITVLSFSEGNRTRLDGVPLDEMLGGNGIPLPAHFSGTSSTRTPPL